MPTPLISKPTQSRDTRVFSYQKVDQHSPRLSRLTEGSEGLAGLVFGTGLDSSLLKKIEVGK